MPGAREEKLGNAFVYVIEGAGCCFTPVKSFNISSNFHLFFLSPLPCARHVLHEQVCMMLLSTAVHDLHHVITAKCLPR